MDWLPPMFRSSIITYIAAARPRPSKTERLPSSARASAQWRKARSSRLRAVEPVVKLVISPAYLDVRAGRQTGRRPQAQREKRGQESEDSIHKKGGSHGFARLQLCISIEYMKAAK